MLGQPARELGGQVVLDPSASGCCDFASELAGLDQTAQLAFVAGV
jgi:hypothetical protein